MYIEMLVKLTLAVLLGGMVGYEREHRSSPAGLRTHILVCIGAVIVQITAFDYYNMHKSQMSIDPLRMGAQVVSGIGFLGAGTIIKEGANIRGLTTAASLWAVGCLGITIGTGLYVESIEATIFIYASLEGLYRFEKRIAREKRSLRISLIVDDVGGRLMEIGNMLDFLGVDATEVESEKLDGRVSIRFQLLVPNPITNERLMEKLMLMDGVSGIKFISQ